jgi:hypothetical protein
MQCRLLTPVSWLLIPKSLVSEPVMLCKINGVRRDLRKFSVPTRFSILLNLNKLSDGTERGRACMHFIRANPE